MLNGLRNITKSNLLFFSVCLMFFAVPLGTSIITTVASITLVLWFLTGQFLILRNKKFWQQEWVLPIICFFLIHWIGLLYTSNYTAGLRFVEKTYYWLFPFVVASLSFNTPFSTEHFVNSFIIGLTLSLFYFVFAFSKITGRGHITFSLFFVFGMLILSFLFKQTKSKKLKFGITLLFFTYLIALIFCQGRIGYLAFLILSPLMLFNFLKKSHYLKIFLMYVAIVVLLLGSKPVQNRIKLFIRDINLAKQGNYKTSIGKRICMWQGAIRIFLHRPLWGVGTGGFKTAVRPYKHSSLGNVDYSHPYNSFLYMAANFGIIGLSILIWLFYILLKTSWHYKNTLVGFFIFSYTLVIIIGSLTDNQIFSCATGIMFGLVIGLLSFLKTQNS